ncbi:MAG: hypothetical protein ACNA7W_17715 [Pseudomonadales bacterium]
MSADIALPRLMTLCLLLSLAACQGERSTVTSAQTSRAQMASENPWLQAGAAAAEVSPQPGAFIAGDARNRRFAGEHDPLYARAVVFAHGEQAAAIVVVDNIGLGHPDVQRIQRRAAELTTSLELAAERILVSSTHTHSGPDVTGLWGEHELSSGRDETYMAQLIEAAARQVAAAAASRQPVELLIGSANVPLSWVENVTEPGLLDSRLTVVRLQAIDGTTVATLTNYACHPTVLDGVSDQVSADYVGGFYRAMSERFDGEHLFLQGAIGGWVQPVKDGRGFELADRYGTTIAEAAQRALAEAEPWRMPRLDFQRHRFEIPLENPGFLALLEAGVLQRPLYDGHIRTEVAYLALGGVSLATHPGETSPAHSLATRQMLGGEHTMVLGLTQDALGYILKPEYFAAATDIPSADYLTATSIGPEAAPRMLQALRAVIPAAH